MSAAAEDREAPVDVGPFDLGEASARSAALCLHGLTGTPYEVRPLGRALADAGVRAVGPVLPGHDTTPEELASLAYTDWLLAASEALRALRSEHASVFVVGLSLGGLLTLALAAEAPVDGVVAIGTPLRFRRAIRWLVPVLKHFAPYLKKSRGSDIRDPVARRRHPSYPVMPLASVHQLIHLQHHVDARLARVTAPILVAHGRHDATASPAYARVLHDGLSSRERALLLLPDSGHVVPVDRDGARLAEAVVQHLLRIA